MKEALKSASIPDHEKSRDEWSRILRKLLSPEEILLPDGTINQDYFKPAVYKKNKVFSLDGEKTWGSYEWNLLKTALCSYAVGDWQQIRENFLTRWSEEIIEEQTKYVLGTSDIQSYIGWKATSSSEIDDILEKNRKLAIEEGRWIENLYVSDSMMDLKSNKCMNESCV
ncbi:hypothetical protein GpartN1_g1708.t1 [Galdieria partita]|uniref:Uncharacterized protein n=1 Tax=Galdieria partita TaxID=83374 RepID=A0A9C7PU04_9RHOD|nr:hypothetical protein GpartN1_g1708.t1 [Galdieria partita]